MVMGRRFHRGFTATEKTGLWDRWKRGESLKRLDEHLVSRHRRSISRWHAVLRRPVEPAPNELTSSAHAATSEKCQQATSQFFICFLTMTFSAASMP
jgi:hypothetical protein